MSDTTVTFKVNANWKQQVNRPIMAFMSKIGAEMEAEAKDLAPEASGTLKESIFHFINNRAPNGQFMGPELILGARAPYAIDVEMGHATTNGGFVDAQPFLRPAAFKAR